jgi:hypothetical protein
VNPVVSVSCCSSPGFSKFVHGPRMGSHDSYRLDGVRNHLQAGAQVGFVLRYTGIFYAAALYTNSAFGNQWFVMFGAFLSAMTSGVFFPVEGAIITIYPEPWYKGRALALWQSMYRVGV